MTDGIENYDDCKGDSRFPQFASIAEPLHQKMRILNAEADRAETRSYECIRTGDRREAAVEADNAYANSSAAHELGKEIDRTARNVLRVDQDGSSHYLGKLPNTPSRKAYLKLERSPNLTPEEQERFLVMISISPDGAAYATLTAERILCGRFAAGEDVISTSAQWAFHYACITGARFLLGERAIMGRGVLWKRYTNRWVVKRCPLCRKQLNKGRCKEHGPRAAGATA